MALKILFINALDPSRPIQRKFPSLGFGYLSSALRQRAPDLSFECTAVDADIGRQLDRYRPDIVGISSVTQNFSRAVCYARLARARGIPVVVGGVHISVLPGSLSPDMDVAVVGEGEETFPELMRAYVARGRFDHDDLRGIRGLAFRDKSGTLVRTEERRLIDPLDGIAPPDRGLFGETDCTYLFTSRGCPYRCVFCASTRYWQKARFFSAERVVSEIEYNVHRGVCRMAFYDDLFAADHERLKRICALLEEKGLIGKATFFTSMRSTMVTEENVGILKKMGVDRIGMGLESGSDRVLAFLKGNGVTASAHKRALDIIRGYGLSVHASFIIGSPDETEQDMRETESFIRRQRVESFDLYALTPFPGTPVWDDALKRGLVHETMDWSRLDVDFARNWKRAVILSKELSRRQLYRVFRRISRLRKQPSRFSSFLGRLMRLFTR